MVPELGMDMFDTTMPLLNPEIDMPQAEALPGLYAQAEPQPDLPELPTDIEAIAIPEAIAIHEEMLHQNGEAAAFRSLNLQLF